MTQSSLQPDGTAPTTQPTSQSESSPSTPVDFWHRFLFFSSSKSSSQPAGRPYTPSDFWSCFRLFPLQFERLSFDYWYVLLILFFSVVLLLDIVWDIHARGLFFFFYDYSLTKNEFTYNLLLNIYIVAIGCLALIFNRWRNSIRETLEYLFSKRYVNFAVQDSDAEGEYLQFLDKYQRALLSNKRYFFIGFIVVFSSIVMLIWWTEIGRFLFFAVSGDLVFSIISRAILIFEYTLIPIVMIYFYSVVAWTMWITGLYIKRLAKEFEFTIQPGHPDHCGGLKVLGDFCLHMALPILVGAILLGLYGIVNILHRIPFWTTFANVFLIAFVLPLATVAFFVPLWNIHRQMLHKRRVYEDEFSERIVRLEEKIRSALDKGELDKAKSAKDEIEIVQVLYSDRIHYPAWPFDLGILLQFLIPQLVAVLSLLIQLGPVVSFVQQVFPHPSP